jgi:hypothetical protein
MGPRSYNVDDFSALLSVLYKPNEHQFLSKEQQAVARYLITEAKFDVNHRGYVETSTPTEDISVGLVSVLDGAIRCRCAPIIDLLLTYGAKVERDNIINFLTQVYPVRIFRKLLNSYATILPSDLELFLVSVLRANNIARDIPQLRTPREYVSSDSIVLVLLAAKYDKRSFFGRLPRKVMNNLTKYFVVSKLFDNVAFLLQKGINYTEPATVLHETICTCDPFITRVIIADMKKKNKYNNAVVDSAIDSIVNKILNPIHEPLSLANLRRQNLLASITYFLLNYKPTIDPATISKCAASDPLLTQLLTPYQKK